MAIDGADNGWAASAAAWIADMGDGGDHGRAHVLDGPMLERLRASGARDMVDIGCGEGRFCRMARDAGLAPIGVDPTGALLEEARLRDPRGTYHKAMAEALPLADACVDLAVFYLTLIDIAGLPAALTEAVRVLRPGGRILIANLAGFITAARHDGFGRNADGTGTIHMRNYLDADAYRTHWRGIDIVNHHRPPAAYMRALLEAGLILTHYDEPPSTHPDPQIRARYNHVAYFIVMEWQKPA